MCKGINLKEHHRHSGKGCELYFVSMVEPSSILPTILTNSGLYGDLLYFFSRVEPSSILPTTLTNSGLYGDLLYFCNVRWLSQGEMLRRVYTLRKKIAIFLEKAQVLPNFAIKNGFLIWHF